MREISFPRPGARDLDGREVTLPAGPSGEWNIVIIAFQRQQQELVDPWVPWLEERAAATQVLADAIAERDLARARDIPSVIDARLRRRTCSLIPRRFGPWSAQLPAIADPERRADAAQVAALIDARKDRIGDHAAEQTLPGRSAPLGCAPAEQPSLPLEALAAALAERGAASRMLGARCPATPCGTRSPGPAPAAALIWAHAPATADYDQIAEATEISPRPAI